MTNHLPFDLRSVVCRCLHGEQAAMIELVDHFKDRVFALCFRMLGHRQDAEDAAQETFVRALRSLARWDAARDFEPWLLAIAANRCRTALDRRRRRPPMCSMESPVPDYALDLPAANQVARELAEEVNLALGQLRREYREAFVLFHEQELSYAEISQVLDCPLGTIKTWVHRARREIITCLQRRGVLLEATHEM